MSKSKSTFEKIYNACTKCVSSDTSRISLNGIFVERENLHNYRMTATDGHIFFTSIISSDDLLLGILEEFGISLDLELENFILFFDKKSRKFTSKSKLIDTVEVYPQWRKIIAKDYTHCSLCDFNVVFNPDYVKKVNKIVEELDNRKNYALGCQYFTTKVGLAIQPLILHEAYIGLMPLRSFTESENGKLEVNI